MPPGPTFQATHSFLDSGTNKHVTRKCANKQTHGTTGGGQRGQVTGKGNAGVPILCKVVKEGLLEEATLKERPEGVREEIRAFRGSANR